MSINTDMPLLRQLSRTAALKHLQDKNDVKTHVGRQERHTGTLNDTLLNNDATRSASTTSKHQHCHFRTETHSKYTIIAVIECKNYLSSV